jgi:hypothetical protein
VPLTYFHVLPWVEESFCIVLCLTTGFVIQSIWKHSLLLWVAVSCCFRSDAMAGQSEMPTEKESPVSEHSEAEVNELQEALDGYVLDPTLYPNGAAGLKLSADGRNVLIPQPSEDALRDPLVR